MLKRLACPHLGSATAAALGHAPYALASAFVVRGCAGARLLREWDSGFFVHSTTVELAGSIIMVQAALLWRARYESGAS